MPRTDKESIQLPRFRWLARGLDEQMGECLKVNFGPHLLLPQSIDNRWMSAFVTKLFKGIRGPTTKRDSP